MVGLVFDVHLSDLLYRVSFLSFSFIFPLITQILLDHEELFVTRACIICRKGINLTENLFICPFCTSSFHRTHLEKWLKIKNSCPVCMINFMGFNLHDKLSVDQRVGLSNRKDTSRHLEPKIANFTHYSTRANRQPRPFPRMNHIEESETKKIKQIGSLIVFLIIIYNINNVIGLFFSILLVPIIISLSIKWFNTHFVL